MKVLPFKRSSLPSDVPSLPHISVNLKLQYPLPTRPPGIRHLNCSVGQILIRCVLQTQNRSIDIGRDPFNQNFRKFRSKTQWIGLVQPEKFRKKWSTYRGDHFSRLDRSDRNEPFHLTIPTHSQSQDLAVRYLPCTKWRKVLITALLYGLLTADLSVLLVHPCTVTTGM